MTENTADWLMGSGFILLTGFLFALTFTVLAVLWMTESATEITGKDESVFRIGS